MRQHLARWTFQIPSLMQTPLPMNEESRKSERHLAAATMIVLATVIAGVYWWIERLLPRGPQEFAYFPFMTDPLPFAPMRGFTFEQLARHLGRTLVLGPSLLLATAGLWLARDWRLGPPSARARRVMLIATTGVSVLTTALVMTRVLEGRAIVDDELVYRQQAELLASGRLVETTVPPWGKEVFTIWTRLPSGEIGAIGKYLFGEPLIQIAGLFVGLPALLHLLLAPLALWAWHRTVDMEAGRRVAFWATLLVAISPMFVLTNALALSHTTTFTCLVLAGLGLAGARGERPIASALLSGTALGFGLTVRPQVVVPMGLVLGLSTLYVLARRRRAAAIVGLIGSGSVWLVLIALYNHTLSGSATTLPWYLFRPIERYGFGHIGGVDFVHTPWTAIENLVVTAVRFNGWWLGWPLSLILVGAWLVLGRSREGLLPWLLGAAAIVLFNVPYYSTGISDTGPIYYFELLLPAALMGAHAIVRALALWPRLVAIALLVHLGLGTTSFMWENVRRLDRLVSTIHAPAEAVLDRITPPALLIHENNWTESLRHGWVWSFPKRFRRDEDPIVTYPRGPAQFVTALVDRYADRECWYSRLEPGTARPQLLRCDDADGLLRRQSPLGPTIRIPSTAERMGLLRLGDSLAGRRQIEEGSSSAAGKGARHGPR